MVTEFAGETFPDTPFPTGEDVLTFYEIEDTNRANDMIVLLCYCMIIHLCSLVVLHVRYNFFKGKITPPSSSSAGGAGAASAAAGKEDGP